MKLLDAVNMMVKQYILIRYEVSELMLDLVHDAAADEKVVSTANKAINRLVDRFTSLIRSYVGYMMRTFVG